MQSAEEQLFEQALEVPQGPARAEFLRAACHGDLPLELRVGQLIAAHESAASILDAPASQPLLQLLADAPADACGESIGPYKLLELIGEGGMGLVYMAEQERPVRRRVAIKIIKPGMDTRQVLARFEAERRALERLDHPGVARVLDAGATPTGRPYFVMELVRGIGITEFCDQAQLGTRARLELFIRVCQAVQHAHESGIIHRDLKPANILVTLHDGVPVPKVIDFGIAKATSGRLVDQTLFTNFLQMIGTPVYMSPEQAQLTSQDVDERSDVYSLGVLLYELLTGTTPFAHERLRNAGYPEVQRIISEEEPPIPSSRLATLPGDLLSTVAARRNVDPRRYSHALRGDLDWIVMRALEKDPRRRYPSAADLAEDVRRHLQHELVQARRPTVMYRASKLIRRRLRTAVVLAMFCVALGVIAAAALVTAHRGAETRRHEDSLRQLAYAGDIRRANEALRRGRLSEAMGLLSNHLPAEFRTDHRGFEWHYLWNRSQAQPHRLDGHAHHVFDVTWSPTGRYMATAGGDRKVIVRDGTTGAPLQTLGQFENDVNSVEFSADESLLAVAEEAHAASVWDWQARRRISRISGFPESLDHVYFTPDPDLILATDVHWTSGDGRTTLCRLSDGALLDQWGHHRVLAVEPSGNQWLLRNPEHYLELRGPTGPSKFVPTRSSDHFESGGFSKDGTRLVSGSGDGTVRLWRLGESVDLLFEIETATRGRDACISADGTLFAACGDDGILHVWDARTGLEQHTLWTAAGRAWSCAFSPDSTRLAVTRDGGAVEVYHLADLLPLNRTIVELHDDRPVIAVDHRGDMLAVSVPEQNRIRIFDLSHGNQHGDLETHPGRRLSALTFSPEGDSLWVGDEQGVLEELNLLTKVQRHSIRIDFAAPGLCLSPDSATIATYPPFARGIQTLDTPQHRNAMFWDVGAGTLILDFRQAHDIYAMSRVVGFMDSERCCVHPPNSNRLEVWNVRRREREATLFDNQYGITNAAIKPDRTLLAIATSEPAIHLWDPSTRRDRHVLFAATPAQLVFSPDGRTVAASFGGVLQLWNVATGQEVLTMPLFQGDCRCLAFSNDSRRLLIAGPVGPDNRVAVLTLEAQPPETREVATIAADAPDSASATGD